MYKARNVMVKYVEDSGGGRHYYLPRRIRKGFMDQVTVEPAMEHVQIRGKTNRTEKKKPRKLHSIIEAKQYMLHISVL